MDLNKLNILPKWEDERFRLDDEGEEWKTVPERAAAKELYIQWRELFGLVIAVAENLSEDEEDEGDDEKYGEVTKRLIYENAMMVAPKILSATGCGLYVLQMENAAIIRTNCRQLMEQVGFAVIMGTIDPEHKVVIEGAMNKFRDLFKTWVATFMKDEFEDEWGLFG